MPKKKLSGGNGNGNGNDADIELLSPSRDDEESTSGKSGQSKATIKGMWKAAFKTLKRQESKKENDHASSQRPSQRQSSIRKSLKRNGSRDAAAMERDGSPVGDSIELETASPSFQGISSSEDPIFETLKAAASMRPRRTDSTELGSFDDDQQQEEQQQDYPQYQCSQQHHEKQYEQYHQYSYD